MCVNGKCACLQGSDGECVDYPIPCFTDGSDRSGADNCQESLPNSICDQITNWYILHTNLKCLFCVLFQNEINLRMWA